MAVPEKLWQFLALRLAEVGFAEPDPDIVTANVGGNWRKVRITGVHRTLLTYEIADGGAGMGLIQRRHVHPNDLGKLSDCLEKLLRDGAIQSAALVRQSEGGYQPKASVPAEECLLKPPVGGTNVEKPE